MKIRNQFSFVIALFLLNSIYLLGQTPDRELTKEQRESRKKSQQDFLNRYGMPREEFIKKYKPVNYSDYVAFDAVRNAEFVFEGIVLTNHNLIKQEITENCDYLSYKLLITKVLRGVNILKNGTIELEYRICATDLANLITKSSEKHIFFCSPSNFTFAGLNNNHLDNDIKISLYNSNPTAYIEFGENGRAGGFRRKHFGSHDSVYTYLKQFRNLNFDAEEKKITSNDLRSVLSNKSEDTTRNYQKQQQAQKVFENQKSEADELMFNRIKNMQISDTMSLENRMKNYEYLKTNFPKSAAYFKENYIDKYVPAPTKNKKKTGANYRIESISTGTASVEYAIRNKSLTNDGVNNYYEFDITAKPSSTIYMDVANLLFSANKDVLGNTPMSSGKFTITKATAFSNSANNYRAFTFDGSALGGFDLQFVAIPVVPSTSTTPPVYNRVQINANTEATLFHAKVLYDINATSCGKSPLHDFTLKNAISLFSTYALSQTLDDSYTFATTTFALSPEVTLSACIASISSITHYSSVLTNAVRAGTYDYIKINGLGFGASRGIGKVEFKNANTGGIKPISGTPDYITIDASDYISWSDTEIQVRVPSYLNDQISSLKRSPAGSGTIRVTNAAGNTIISSQVVTVKYAIENQGDANGKYRHNIVRNNCVNGIEFRLENSINLHVDKVSMISSIEKALNDWKNYFTSIGYTIDLRLKKDAQGNVDFYTGGFSATDKINLIKIGNQFANNGIVMANLDSPNRYLIENTSTGKEAFKNDIDIEINSGATFNYDQSGYITNGIDNFYVAFLHEIGHGLGIDHEISASELMHYAPTAGNTYTLNTATQTAKAAVLDIANYSNAVAWSPNPITGNNIGKLNSTSPIPTIYASNGTSFCSTGFSTTLTPSVTDATTYAWYKDGNFITGAIFGTYNATAFGDYYVVIGKNGCTAQSNTLSIIQGGGTGAGTGPTITSQSGSTTLCQNTPVTFSVNATGSAPLTYQWYKSNVAINGANGSSLSLNSRLPTPANPTGISDASTYKCKITNACGTALESQPITLTINPVPTVWYKDIDKAICLGSNFYITVGCAGVTSYQWYRDGAAIAGATGSSYNIGLVTDFDLNKTYRCDLTGICGTGSSQGYVSKANPTASLSGGGNYCSSPPNINVNLTGQSPWTFAYKINGGTTQTVSSSSINPTILSPANQAGMQQYQLVSVSNDNCGAGSVSSATVSATKIAPTAGISGGGNFCEAGSTLSKTATISLNGTPPYIVNLSYIDCNISTGNGCSTYVTLPSINTSASSYSFSVDISSRGYVKVYQITSVADANCPSGTANPQSAGFLRLGTNQGCGLRIGSEDEIELSNELSISPNPAQEHISLKGSIGEEREYTIRFFDGLGIEVSKAKKINSSYIDETFNLNNMASGMYFIEVNGNSAYKILKFVKE